MSLSMMANGNISPSRFLKLDATKVGGYVIQATAGSGSHGDPVIGISQPGVRQPPISGLDDGFAGIQDVNAIEVFTTNDECWVQCGAAVTFGDYLKSDANAKAITASSSGDFVGAQALQTSTAADQLVRVRVMTFMHS